MYKPILNTCFGVKLPRVVLERNIGYEASENQFELNFPVVHILGRKLNKALQCVFVNGVISFPNQDIKKKADQLQTMSWVKRDSADVDVDPIEDFISSLEASNYFSNITERVLEELISQITKSWNSYCFQLADSKKRVKIVCGWEEVFGRLKEDMNSINATRSSSYFNQFHKKVVNLDEKLNLINKIGFLEDQQSQKIFCQRRLKSLKMQMTNLSALCKL